MMSARIRTSHVGKVVDGYLLVAQIGQGGMGSVYRAEHQLIPKHRAAIKVLDLPQLSEDEAYRIFLNEARALAQVRHPSLCQVFNYSETDDGDPCIVMELVEGLTLRQYLHEFGTMKLDAATELIQQMAAALQVIHHHGIVHCDLKPDNIMLVNDPSASAKQRIKILDFGIARMVANTGIIHSPGIAAGTQGYMAPEQQLGGVVGPRADIYALGVIYRELISGSRSLDAALPEIDSLQEKLLRAMLAKEPRERPTAQRVVETLADRNTFGTVAKQIKFAAERLQISPVLAKRLRWILLVMGFVVSSEPNGKPPPSMVAITPPPDMVFIPGARFFVGSTQDEVNQAYADCLKESSLCCESPQLVKDRPVCSEELFNRQRGGQSVDIKPFFIDRVEVSNSRYADWLNSLNADIQRVRVNYGQWVFYDDDIQLLDLKQPPSGISYVNRKFIVQPELAALPVVQVSWDGAERFCASHGKTLPSEAQWELVARGAERRRYPWGQTFTGSDCSRIAVARSSGLFCGHLSGLAEVGQSPGDRTPEGVLDIGGNAVEWMSDGFRQVYALPIHSATRARSDSEMDYRSLRGGSFDNMVVYARGSDRSRWERNRGATNLGFRCTLSAP